MKYTNDARMTEPSFPRQVFGVQVVGLVWKLLVPESMKDLVLANYLKKKLVFRVLATQKTSFWG